MAAKRIQDASDEQDDPHHHHPYEKPIKRLPSFATVIKEVMTVRTSQNLFKALEPQLRRVVNEEVERALSHANYFHQRFHQLPQTQEVEASNLQLIFRKPLSLPIFTTTKIEDVDGDPLQILLVHDYNKNGLENTPVIPQSPIKLEIVVLDGDFPVVGRENWISTEFDRSIVKEREGRRPLIIGEVYLTMKDSCSVVVRDLVFTDNSSWIRSRHFRVGVRVAQASNYQGLRIKEAITNRFIVKDHRGESYKKHYPPSLTDEVWRLEKIGKDGTFHKRLTAENIYTVEDFLKMHSVDQGRLRKILGIGMSDRTWEMTLNHAKTCVLGEKIYVYRGLQCDLLLNSICEVAGIVMGNLTLPPQDQLPKAQRELVQQMAKEAYDHWDMVEEMSGMLENSPLLNMEKHLGSGSQDINTLLQFHETSDFDEMDEAGSHQHNMWPDYN